MSDKFPVRFDAVRLIEAMGGNEATHQALRAVGCKTQRKTVQKWRERNSIPAHAVAAILLYKMRGGEILMLQDYLQEAT